MGIGLKRISSGPTSPAAKLVRGPSAAPVGVDLAHPRADDGDVGLGLEQGELALAAARGSE